MHFRLNNILSEDDYVAFNLFHSMDRPEGKRNVVKSRILFLSLFLVAVVVLLFLLRPTLFSVVYCILLGIWICYRIFCLRWIVSKNIKRHLKRIKKIGKAPFSPNATLEFYDDHLVETTEATRLECKYSAIERVYVVGDQYIFLYNSAHAAFILCISQVKAQVNYTDFLQFLSEKCNPAEHYERLGVRNMKRFVCIMVFLSAAFLLLLWGCSETRLSSGSDVTLNFRVYGENICVKLPEDESQKVIEILDGNSYRSFLDGIPSCGFSKEVSLEVDSRVFAIARDTCNCVQDLGNLKYFNISKEDIEYIHTLFEKYGGYFPCI